MLKRVHMDDFHNIVSLTAGKILLIVFVNVL